MQTQSKKPRILALSGSLRRDSYNTQLCRALAHHCADIAIIDVFVLTDIPLFNQDIEHPMPSSVSALLTALEQADAVIFSTPEYNNTYTGVLKNTLDWISRGPFESVRTGMVAGITGASDGGFGAVRAQHDLFGLLAYLGFRVYKDLRLPVSHAQDVFTQDGKFADEHMIERSTAFVRRLCGYLT